jgi:hypothetical protein
MGRLGLVVKSAPKLQQIEEQVERWRRSRTRRTRMPEELWKLVVPVAREQGVYGVAKKLRLNCQALKKRMAPAGAGGRLVRPQPAKFVELRPVLPVATGPAVSGAVVELLDTTGNRLIVHATGAADAVALVRELWSRR